jgi:hypothetical protein
MARGMSSNRRIVLSVAIGAALIALGAGVVYLLSHSPIAMRVLLIAGPVALMAIFFVLLQAWFSA